MLNKNLQHENTPWNYKLMVQNFLDALPQKLNTVTVDGRICDETVKFEETAIALLEKTLFLQLLVI